METRVEVCDTVIGLNFAIRPTCKQLGLGNIFITSDYYELICYQTHEEQIVSENVGCFHSHEFQEYLTIALHHLEDISLQVMDFLAFR